jgi:hypothetical protein
MPKTFTRKVRNIFKRLFNNKEYKEEKRVAMERRDRMTQQREKMKKEVDELLAEYQDKEALSFSRRLPSPPRTSKRGGRRRKQRKTRRKR